jgi:hypothetical protein
MAWRVTAKIGGEMMPPKTAKTNAEETDRTDKRHSKEPYEHCK